MVNKKSIIKNICLSYTILSLMKLGLDTVSGQIRFSYLQTFINMLLISILAVGILNLHYSLLNLPVPLVIVIQYVAFIAIIMGILWINSFFMEINAVIYHNMFWSASIPYAVGAVVHYLYFWHQLKKANQIIKNLK